MIARLIHQRLTDPRIGEWLGILEGSELVKDPHSDAAVNVRETRREYDRATKLPSSLVEELAKTAVLAMHAWAEARKQSNFPHFRPWLGKMLDLKRDVAKCVGYSDHPYDAMLDAYEPHETTAGVRKVFETLRAPLVELVGAICESRRRPDKSLVERRFPIDRQEAFARNAAKAIGFDFEEGRLATSVHPFCSGLGPGDTRMTTRYDENYFNGAFFGVLHETGHAMYEQGLPKKSHFGQALADAISLGIHESQSRMWENLVGRSDAFWAHFWPMAQEAFPESLGNVSRADWVAAINTVEPSFIRVEADETTYNLHILIRFELETAMMEGQLQPNDIPGAWNEKYRKYLGITPQNDAEGCLQDVHWSHGLLGYFPTYTLGNLYASQFFEQAGSELGDLAPMFARGEFAPLLSWLREKIHKHGKRYTAAQLVQNVTGRPLSAEPLLRHLRNRAREVYGV